MTMHLSDSRDFLANPFESFSRRSSEHLLSGGSGGRCWIRRTRLERCLIVTVVICLIMLLGFIIGVAVLNNDLDQIERDLKSAQATIDQLKNPTTLPSTSTSTTSPTTMPSTTEADLTTGTEDTTTEAVLDSTTVTATETASDSATSDTTETIPTSTNVSATSTTPPAYHPHHQRALNQPSQHP